MDLQTLTAFFMWCTVVDGALFLLWTAFIVGAPDLTYRIQSRFVHIERARYDELIYAFLGLFKIGLIFFNLTPWIALSAIG